MLALRPRLRRFAYGLSGSLAEADDIVQATYQRAIERIWQWRPDSRLDSWMLAIAHRIWIDLIRRESGRRRSLASSGQLQTNGGAVLDGARAVEARILLEDVRRIVMRLPEEQKGALLLVGVEGLSYIEAARVLGIPIGTLTSRLARGREALRAALEGREPAGNRGPESLEARS